MDRQARESLQFVSRLLRHEAAKVDTSEPAIADWLEGTAADLSLFVASDEGEDDGQELRASKA